MSRMGKMPAEIEKYISKPAVSPLQEKQSYACTQR
jgi:hypothetical protein